MTRKTWRCFFCDEVFRSPKAAALHFGEFDSCEPDVTACKLMSHQQHVLEYIRGLEEEIRLYQAENHPTIQAMYAVEDEMRRAVKCAEASQPCEVMIPTSDANDLDDVVRELGIEASETTPAEAVRELKAESDRLRAELAAMTERAEIAEDTVGCQADIEKDLAGARADLKDWQDSSEAYRHDAEKAEAHIKELNNKWADDVLRVDRAEAERDALREARWWMSWDSAPKDGRWIVAVCNDMVSLLRVSWGNNREGHLAWCSNTSSYGDGDGLFAGWIDCPTKVFGARAALSPSPDGREG